MQGFTGTLQGNESAGVSNLQGLQVTCNACKKIERKTLKSVGNMFYRDTAGKTPHNLLGKHSMIIGKVGDNVYRENE